MAPYCTRSIGFLCHRSPAWVTAMARKHRIGILVKQPNTPGRGMWMFTMDDWATMAKLCRYNKGGK